MQTIPWLMGAGSGAGANTPEEPLQIAIFYSDFEMGSHTLQIFSRLADSLDHDFLLRLSVWHLADCRDSQQLHNGATAAALADLIFLGLRDGKSLPYAQRRLAREVMLRRAGRPGLLIRVTVSGPKGDGPASCRLQSNPPGWLSTPTLSEALPAPRSGCGEAERRAKIARGLARVFGEPQRSRLLPV